MLYLRFAAAAAAVAHAVNASVFVVNASSDFGVWEGWGTSLCWWVRRATMRIYPMVLSGVSIRWAKAFGDRDDLADAFFTRSLNTT